MSTESPKIPRAGARRAPTSPTKIPAASLPLGKIAPYAIAAMVVGALVFLIRTPRFTAIGTISIVGVAFCALGYFALSPRENLPIDDSLRTLLPLVTVLSLIAAIVPFAYTVFPPHARGDVSLSSVGDTQHITVRDFSASNWIGVDGRFVPTATGSADYFISISHDGGSPEHIEGILHPHPGGPPLPEHHLLSVHGPGDYTVRLEQASAAVAMPLHVALNVRPFSTLVLILLYGCLAIAIVALDTMLWRRGIEPAFAASLLLPLVSAVYFQRNGTSNSLPGDLLAAGIVGLLGGGIGGELLGRLVRMFVRK